MNFNKLIRSESKNSLIYLSSTLITGFGSFVIIPIYWAKLSLSDYGLIAVTEMITGFLGLFLGLNLEQGITRFYYEWSAEGKREGIGSLWLMSWLSILLVFPLFYVLFNFVGTTIFPTVPFDPFIFLGLVIAFLTPFDKIPTVVFRMVQKPMLYASLNILSFIITNGLALIFVFVFEKGVYGYLIAIVISKLVMIIVFTVVLSKFARIIIKWNYIKQTLPFSINFIFPDFISAISTYGDRYLLQIFMNIHTLGIYSVSMKFGTLFNTVHNIIKLSFIPFLIKTTSTIVNGDLIVQRMVPFYVLPLFVGFVGVSYFGDNFILMIGNAEYFSIVDYLPWVCLALLIPNLYMYYAPGIYLSKKSSYLVYPTLASSAVFLALAPFIIPKYSIAGLITLKVLAGLAYIFVSVFLSYKLYKWKNNYSIFSLVVIVSAGFVLLDLLLLKPFNFNSILIEFILFLFYLAICFLLFKNEWKLLNADKTLAYT